MFCVCVLRVCMANDSYLCYFICQPVAIYYVEHELLQGAVLKIVFNIWSQGPFFKNLGFY